MLLALSASSALSVSSPVAPLREPAAPVALHAAAFPATGRPLNQAERAAFLARRRAILKERAKALGLGLRVRSNDPDEADGFAPAARQSLAQIERCPLLSAQERARVRLEVALARDGEEWQIGRSVPCRWLVLVG